MPSGPDCGDRRLRADAAANRDRVVAAAQKVFGEHGVDAPLSQVAQEAGVGIATLYRRFPDRGALVDEAFRDVMARYQANADEALAEPDPWRGFVMLVVGMGRLQTENRGFGHLVRSAPVEPGTGRARLRGYRSVVAVVDRARAAGVVRADLRPEDLPVVSFAIEGIREVTSEDLPDAWERHVALVLDGCRPQPGSHPLPPAPDARRLQRAMLRARRRLRRR